MAVNYGQNFSALTTWQVTGATHGIGHKRLRVQCWDAGSPRRRLRPGTLRVHPTTFTVTASFLPTQPQSGLMVIDGAYPSPGLQGTKRPPAESWWVQKLSADFTAD